MTAHENRTGKNGGREALIEAARHETARIYGNTVPEHVDPAPEPKPRQTKPKHRAAPSGNPKPEPMTPPWAAHLTQTRDRLAARRKAET